MQSAGNWYFIRNIQANRSTTTADLPRQLLSVDPPCAEFHDYPSSKISICRLTLRNDSRFPRRIALVQPAKAYFEVKVKSRDLPPKEATELYVVFDPKREKGRIEDEFCVRVEGEGTVLHVPILCQYKAVGRAWSSKQIIAAKQNEEERAGRAPQRGRRPQAVRNRHISIEQRQSTFLDLKRLSLLQFHEKFDRVSRYVEEKKVKNEVYRGEHPLEPNTRAELTEYAHKVVEIAHRTVGRAAGSRWTVEYREDGPVVQAFSGVALGWDSTRNSAELVFRNGVGKMQEEVRKFVVSLRFDKIKHYLALFRDYRAREESAGKTLRVEDYLEQLARTENSRSSGELEFQFDKGSLRHEELLVDYQRGPTEVLFRERNARFDIVQRIGFDNWVPMNVLRKGHSPSYQLTEHAVHPHHLHLPASVRENRRGATAELPFRTASKDQHELPAAWPRGEWPERTAREVLRRRDKYYYEEMEDKVAIGEDGLCLGGDPEGWLQNYIKQI